MLEFLGGRGNDGIRCVCGVLEKAGKLRKRLKWEQNCLLDDSQGCAKVS